MQCHQPHRISGAKLFGVSDGWIESHTPPSTINLLETLSEMFGQLNDPSPVGNLRAPLTTWQVVTNILAPGGHLSGALLNHDATSDQGLGGLSQSDTRRPIDAPAGSCNRNILMKPNFLPNRESSITTANIFVSHDADREIRQAESQLWEINLVPRAPLVLWFMHM